MNKEILRMQMLSGIITESEYKAKLKKNKSPLNENLKFSQIEKDRKYFATTNFGIFKKGDEVFVDTVRNLGNEVVIELSNNKEQSDSIKGDLEDEVEVFDNDMKESLNENFVGMEMVGNIFDREKTDYEIAFEHFSKGKMNEEMDSNIGKEELVKKIKNLGDFGFTGDKIEFKGLLITASTQEDEDETPYYFVYGEDDESEDGIFQSTNPNKVAEFVFNY
jgi:hypothetical protein